MRHLVARVVLVCVLFAGGPAMAEKLSPGDFESRANGTIELARERHSPIHAEFEQSRELTTRLRQALVERGFELATDRKNAKATLVFRGTLRLSGGSVYHKAVVLPIGDAVEAALRAAAQRGQVRAADVVGTGADVALASAGYAASPNQFTRGLKLSFMVASISHTTGLTAELNRKVGLDPRGICLARCDEWNKVEQTALLHVSLDDAGGNHHVRVMTKVKSEIVAPDEVLTRALEDAMQAIRVVPATAEDRP